MVVVVAVVEVVVVVVVVVVACPRVRAECTRFAQGAQGLQYHTISYVRHIIFSGIIVWLM